MEIPEVNKMADLINEMIAAQTSMDELVRSILANPDQRTVREQFAAQASMSLNVAMLRLAESQQQTLATAKQFGAIIYYLDLEATRPAPGVEWRQIADAQSNYRISIDAVRALRIYSGMSLEEARLVVEGYQAGLFK
ncbi:hypothetical protein [Pseudomonas phage D6]|nr:hypothetical protein [Pseudomonas phage D6]